jgi:hypothetical protein
LENKPRKPWIAGSFSFFTIGLGHIYAGEAKKGIVLYLCQGLLLAILLPLLIFKPDIFSLLFTIIAFIAYWLYSLIDVKTDPHISPKGDQERDNFGPLTVPDNKLFVMGDNYDNSYDSRFWGYADITAVKSKAVSLYWSWDKENFRVRWDRIGKEIK